MANRDDAALGCGCFIICVWIAWIAFLIWAGITVVNWLVTK